MACVLALAVLSDEMLYRRAHESTAFCPIHLNSIEDHMEYYYYCSIAGCLHGYSSVTSTGNQTSHDFQKLRPGPRGHIKPKITGSDHAAHVTSFWMLLVIHKVEYNGSLPVAGSPSSVFNMSHSQPNPSQVSHSYFESES